MLNIFNCSGGKDSIAQILLALEKGIKIDIVLYSEVRFQSGFEGSVSGELPEMRNFIFKTLVPFLEKTDKNIHFEHVTAQETYLDVFFHYIERSEKNKGRQQGFPLPGRCWVNPRLKIKPIEKFLKGLKEPYQVYLGLAADEQKRLSRLKLGQKSLLALYDITEADCFKICEKYGLLSPVYKYKKRCGCWFCPAQSKQDLIYLAHKEPDLFRGLIHLEEMSETLCPIVPRFKHRDCAADLFQKCLNTPLKEISHE